MDKLQWGNRKRLRCMKLKDSNSNGKSDGGVKKRLIPSGVVDNSKETHVSPLSSPHRLISFRKLISRTDFYVSKCNRDLAVNRSLANENRQAPTSSSPEKEDRYYTTRGSVVLDDAKPFVDAREENRKMVWPKLVFSLSSKEKEEDFLAMKGCKLPQRPKKRAKLIQRTILLVSPGTWLSDLCQERYEVREKKTSKKKPRGLKAMGGIESDSE